MPAASAPAPSASTATNDCVGRGSFDLAALLSACEVPVGDPRIKAGLQPTTAKLAWTVEPGELHAKGGDTITLDATVTNRDQGPAEAFIVVRTDEWFQVEGLGPRGERDWRRLKFAPGPNFPASRGARAAWYAAITLAPGAIGRTRFSALVMSTVNRHLQAPPGQPAPWQIVDAPLEPGAYPLRFIDPLASATFEARDANGSKVVLFVDP